MGFFPPNDSDDIFPPLEHRWTSLKHVLFCSCPRPPKTFLMEDHEATVTGSNGCAGCDPCAPRGPCHGCTAVALP